MNTKKTLPSICFLAEFKKHSVANIISSSGLTCLDFDKFNDGEESVLREQQIQSLNCKSVFYSPHGLVTKIER